MAKNRSRRSVSGKVKSENSHLLTKLLRCHECGTELWSQTQSSGGKTYYKSPDRGMSVVCRHQGRSFVGWQIEEQVERLFEGFQLREDWIDWIIEHHIKGQDYAAVKKRQSIHNQIERARHRYLTGEIDWKSFTVVKNQAEADLVSLHIPEIVAATGAGERLANFGGAWRTSTIGVRNRMLRTVLETVYVDLDRRKIVGLLPKPDYCSAILAMADRDDFAVRPAETGHLTGNGGDGGGRGSSVLTWPFNVRLRRSSPSKQRTISGHVIKQSRIALRISQTDLAASLGIDRQTLRSWEKGDTVPGRRHQNLLLKCLDARVKT